MKVIGTIRSVDDVNRMISIHHKNRVTYYYFERAEYNRFEKYLELGRFIEFESDMVVKFINRTKTYKVAKVSRIMQHRHRRATLYYDIKKVRKDIKSLMRHHSTRMFLDLELSMHPYYKTDEFVQEIIQVGYVLENDEGLIESFETYVKPVKYPVVTDRTIKFLSITQENIDEGMDAIDLYNHFDQIMKEHNPKIYVWGKNDYLAFQQFAKILKRRNNMPRKSFIDLLALYKTYHGLKNDVGLFNCYQSFGFELNDQIHHALEDAEITRLIYHAFLNDVKEHIEQ